MTQIAQDTNSKLRSTLTEIQNQEKLIKQKDEQIALLQKEISVRDDQIKQLKQ